MTSRAISVGWVVDSTPTGVITWPWQGFSSVAEIRYAGLARHLAKTDPTFRMRLYRPWHRYDMVVFVKMMNEACYELAQRLKRQGVRIVFDANVNYYEEWGDYAIPGTRPTPNQRQQAIRMTELADHVVADSTYLEKICRRHNDRVTWIPDAVDTDRYHPAEHNDSLPSSKKLRLIWSGVRKKAYHLELLESVVQRRKDRLDFTLVTDSISSRNPEAPILQRLVASGAARLKQFDPQQYPQDLQQADIIVSPKILTNAYEVAHTEYKITLGMAAGLPALASPQASYLEALSDGQGGRICHNDEDWDKALDTFETSAEQRRDMGRRARQRVLQQYAIPVVARRYGDVLRNLAC